MMEQEKRELVEQSIEPDVKDVKVLRLKIEPLEQRVAPVFASGGGGTDPPFRTVGWGC